MGSDLIVNLFNEHPYLSGVMIEISGTLLEKTSTWVGKKFFKKRTDLEKLLTNCYERTVLDIRDEVCKEESDRDYIYQKHFFKSKKFSRLLIEAALLDKKLDPVSVLSILSKDNYTYRLSEENIIFFINRFKKHAVENEKFKNLEIKELYPIKIFGIDAKLDDIFRRLRAKEIFLEEKLQAVAKATQDDANFIDNIRWSKKRKSIFLSDLYIHRDIEFDIRSELEKGESDFSLFFISGEAGNGKTSFLWSLNQYYKEFTNDYPLFIKAVHLLNYDFAEYLQFLTADLDKRVVVLLDTIDLLLHKETDRQKLIDFLYTISGLNIICIATCRPQELPSLASIQESIKYKVIKLESYSLETELPAAIRKYAEIYYENLVGSDFETTVDQINNLVTDNRSLKELCLNPLTNRMLFTLYAPNALPTEINVFKLYSEFWNQRVIRDARAGSLVDFAGDDISKDLQITAMKIAFIMVAEGSTIIDPSYIRTIATQYSILWNEIDLLISRGVIRSNEESGFLEFFHQTFFEHAAARAALHFCKGSAIDTFGQKADQLSGNEKPNFFFIPIIEHLLLFAEHSPYLNAVISYTGKLIQSELPESLRTGFYLYALFDKEYPELRVGLHSKFGVFPKDENVYIKRFLRVASSTRNERIEFIFGFLDIIWNRRIWNEQYHLLDLLMDLSGKNPVLTKKFIEDHNILLTIKDRLKKGGKREHEPILENVMRIYFNLSSSFYQFATNQMLEVIELRDRRVNYLLIEWIRKHPALEKDEAFVSELEERIIKSYRGKIKNSKEGNPPVMRLLSDVLIVSRKIPDMSAGELIEILEKEASSSLYNAWIIAIAKSAPSYSPEDAEILFTYLRGLTGARWFQCCRWLLPYLGVKADGSLSAFEEIINKDIRKVFAENVSAPTQAGEVEEIIMKGYQEVMSKMSFDSPTSRVRAFETLYLDKKFLSAYPALVHVFLIAHRRKIGNTISVIHPFDREYFLKNQDTGIWFTKIISGENIQDEDLVCLLIDISLSYGKINTIMSQLERVSHRVGAFGQEQNYPAYLIPYKEAVYEMAISHILYMSRDKKLEGAHLLVILLSLGLVETITLEQIETLFPNERNHEFKSWIIEMYPFCSHATAQQAEKIINNCVKDFDDIMPNTINKSRIAFLDFICRSHLDLSTYKEKIIESLFQYAEFDYKGTRIKRVNRIIDAYSTRNIDTAFYLFYSLITSNEFKNYQGRKQNETVYELNRGCVSLCRNLEIERLKEICNLLYITSCDYARLLLNGLTFDREKLRLIQSYLNEVRLSSTVEPCVKDQVTNILRYKLHTSEIEKWPELLTYMN